MGESMKCNNCGVEISEEEYYSNDGLCTKCFEEISGEQIEFWKTEG
jgi:hypothetical protein